MESPAYRQLCSTLTLQSKKEGFFNDYLASVKQEMDQATWAECVDSAAKVNYVWGLPNAHKISLCTVFKAKDAKEAMQKRVDGNKAFEKKEYAKAVLLYTQSVIFSPAPNSGQEEPVLALALANRSAALLHMQEWQLCVQDVQYALQCGYPENQRYKLYDRLAQCYHNMNEPTKSETARDIFLSCVDKAGSLTNEKKEQLKADLRKKLERPIQKLSNNSTPSKATLYKPGNSVFPNASKSFDVAVSKSMGRYAVAKEEIKPGENLVVESPLAACLVPERFGTHCHHCLQRLKIAYGCENCRSVAFCSFQCLEKAQSYHSVECSILDVLIGSGISAITWLAMRILTRMDVNNFMNLRDTIEAQEGVVRFGKSGTYEADKYETFYNLCTLENDRESSDMFDRTVMAVFLLKCLQTANYFQTIAKAGETLGEQELWIAELLLRHLHIVQFNAHEIVEPVQPEVNNVRKFKNASLGLGIYNTVALCNHSCYPAVTRYFQGSTMVLTSTRSIAPKEMIAENYGPIFTSMAKKQRQDYLLGRYWFDCCCQACRDDWPLYDQLTSRPQFLCPSESCKQKLMIHPSRNAICMPCKKAHTVVSLLKTLETVETIYCEGMESLGKGYMEDAAQRLVTFIQKAEKLACPPYRELHLAQDALRHCITTRGTTYYPALDKFKM